MKKKLLVTFALVIVMVLAFALVACGGDDGDWEVTYKFAEDGSTCVAQRVYKTDASKVETLTATITSEVLVEPTCTTTGKAKYTATFDKDWAKTQTIEVVLPIRHAEAVEERIPATYSTNEVIIKVCPNCDAELERQEVPGSMRDIAYHVAHGDKAILSQVHTSIDNSVEDFCAIMNIPNEYIGDIETINPKVEILYVDGALLAIGADNKALECVDKYSLWYESNDFNEHILHMPGGEKNITYIYAIFGLGYEENNIVYSDSHKEGIMYVKGDKAINIPASVEYMAPYAFAYSNAPSVTCNSLDFEVTSNALIQENIETEVFYIFGNSDVLAIHDAPIVYAVSDAVEYLLTSSENPFERYCDMSKVKFLNASSEIDFNKQNVFSNNWYYFVDNADKIPANNGQYIKFWTIVDGDVKLIDMGIEYATGDTNKTIFDLEGQDKVVYKPATNYNTAALEVTKATTKATPKPLLEGKLTNDVNMLIKAFNTINESKIMTYITADNRRMTVGDNVLTTNTMASFIGGDTEYSLTNHGYYVSNVNPHRNVKEYLNKALKDNLRIREKDFVNGTDGILDKVIANDYVYNNALACYEYNDAAGDELFALYVRGKGEYFVDTHNTSRDISIQVTNDNITFTGNGCYCQLTNFDGYNNLSLANGVETYINPMYEILEISYVNSKGNVVGEKMYEVDDQFTISDMDTSYSNRQILEYYTDDSLTTSIDINDYLAKPYSAQLYAKVEDITSIKVNVKVLHCGATIGKDSFTSIKGVLATGTEIDILFEDITIEDTLGTFNPNVPGVTTPISIVLDEDNSVKAEVAFTVEEKYDQVLAKEPTCNKNGNKEYYQGYVFKYFKNEDGTYTKIENDGEVIPMLGHDYGETVYAWSNSGSSCIAIRTCSRCGYTDEASSTSITNEVIKASTCEVKGDAIYTATFSVPWATSSTKTLYGVLPLAPHTLVAVDRVDPSPDAVGYKAHYKCSVCGKLFDDPDGNIEVTLNDLVISKQVDYIEVAEVAATCVATGVMAHYKDANDTLYLKNKYGEYYEVKAEDLVIEKIAHNWGVTSYTWSEDGKSCTATRRCSYDTDGTHIETAEATTISGVKVADPTCTKAGSTKYTATFDVTWAAAGSEKTIADIPATDHDYKEGYFSNSTEHWRECKNCTERIDVEKHNFGTSNTCSVCGAEKTIFEFTHDSTTDTYTISGLVSGADTSITRLIIPSMYTGKKVTKVGYNVLDKFPNIEELTLGDNLEYVYANVPSNVASFNRINVSSMQNYLKINFNSSSPLRTGVDLYINGVKFDGNLVVPADVPRIGNYAFYQSPLIKSVTFAPNGICSEIGSNAFFTCLNLKTIKIPASMRTIGNFAFERAENLTSLSFEEGVETIGSHAFAFVAKTYNNIISEPVVIPKSVKTLEGYAFYSTGNIQNLILPVDGNLEIIGESALDSACLPGVFEIPHKVKSIGNDAFVRTYVHTFILPDTVTTLGITPFNTYADDIKVFYKATDMSKATKWSAKWNGADQYRPERLLRMYLYSETSKTAGMPENIAGYWHFVNTTPTVWA